MRLLLIRHGQTTGNVAGTLDSLIPGPELTPLGYQQARELPKTLDRHPIDAIYVSTLIRTHQTAGPLARARQLHPIERDGLREATSGDYEASSDAAAVADYLDRAKRWILGDLDVRMPGGESGQELLARVDEVVAEAHAAGHRRVALVSHGTTLRVWAARRATNVPAEFAVRTHLTNTGIVVLGGSPADGWVAESWLGKELPLGATLG